MKELIGQILNSSKDRFFSHEIIEIGYDSAIDSIVELIQDQENKPFDPVECGLIFDNDVNAEHDGWIKEFRAYGMLNRYILIRVTNDDYCLSIQQLNSSNEWWYYENIVKSIKIPNHRQGVELLRNLGVIE